MLHKILHSIVRCLFLRSLFLMGDDVTVVKLRSAKDTKKWTVQFTEYNLFFNTAEKIRRGESIESNTSNSFCREISSRMICANPNYQPRILSRNQITWKMKSDESNVNNFEKYLYLIVLTVFSYQQDKNKNSFNSMDSNTTDIKNTSAAVENQVLRYFR